MDIQCLDSNIVIAIIALFAFLVSLWQTASTRKHNRLSVRPILCTWKNINTTSFSFIIKNSGIGPAIIKDVTIFLNDKKIEGNDEAIIHEIIENIFSDYPHQCDASLFSAGYVFAINEQVEIANVKFTTLKSPSKDEINQKLSQVRLVVNYESAYQKKVKLDTDE